MHYQVFALCLCFFSFSCSSSIVLRLDVFFHLLFLLLSHFHFFILLVFLLVFFFFLLRIPNWLHYVAIPSAWAPYQATAVAHANVFQSNTVSMSHPDDDIQHPNPSQRTCVLCTFSWAHRQLRIHCSPTVRAVGQTPDYWRSLGNNPAVFCTRYSDGSRDDNCSYATAQIWRNRTSTRHKPHQSRSTDERLYLESIG